MIEMKRYFDGLVKRYPNANLHYSDTDTSATISTSFPHISHRFEIIQHGNSYSFIVFHNLLGYNNWVCYTTNDHATLRGIFMAISRYVKGCWSAQCRIERGEISLYAGTPLDNSNLPSHK